MIKNFSSFSGSSVTTTAAIVIVPAAAGTVGVAPEQLDANQLVQGMIDLARMGETVTPEDVQRLASDGVPPLPPEPPTEPLEPSAWLERWSAQEGVRIERVGDAREAASVAVQFVRTPLPTLRDAAWALPEQVTATSYEALRQCPYRFFATSVLALREQDELEEGVDRQDQGIWLHAVLKRFHEGRPSELAPALEADDVARWLEVAQALAQEQGLSSDTMRAHFLPYQTTLQSLAEHYVHWLRQHEQSGWRVASMEDSKQTDLPLFTDDAGHAAEHEQRHEADHEERAHGRGEGVAAAGGDRAHQERPQGREHAADVVPGKSAHEPFLADVAEVGPLEQQQLLHVEIGRAHV